MIAEKQVAVWDIIPPNCLDKSTVLQYGLSQSLNLRVEAVAVGGADMSVVVPILLLSAAVVVVVFQIGLWCWWLYSHLFDYIATAVKLAARTIVDCVWETCC